MTFRRGQVVTVTRLMRVEHRIFPNGLRVVPGLRFRYLRKKGETVVVQMTHGTKIHLPADAVVTKEEERAA